MSKPHADLVRLHVLAGRWAGQEVVRPGPWDPQGATYQSRCTMALGANGFVLTCSTEQHKDDQLTFSGHGVFWHDADSGRVHLHSWDLFGAPPDVFRGGWEDDRLVLVCHNSMGHWRYAFHVGDDGRSYVQEMETSKDGETWTPLSEGSYQRE